MDVHVSKPWFPNVGKIPGDQGFQAKMNVLNTIPRLFRAAFAACVRKLQN
jgi:hypothetical protein